MAQQRLNRHRVHPGFQQMGGKAMSERVDAFTFVDLRFLFCPVVNSLGVVNRKRTAFTVREKVNRRTMLFPIRVQLG